jgi:phthalate 3,4-dioxygenase subunit alpha
MAVDVAQLTADIAAGDIPALIYNDRDIFELERERIFGSAWLFLAHEAEIPSAGDYVVRRIVDDSFIVIRDEQGRIRVHFNMCLHRGMQLCRAERGNASHFRCPYHGWSYNNAGELVGVPFHADAYGGEHGLSPKEKTLVTPGRIATYNGLIFASLDPAAPELEDYLGGFRYYLDFYTRQSDAGLDVRGPQRWRVKADWKIGAENFCGDSYHTPHTHVSIVEIELFGDTKARKRKQGALYFTDNGGGTTYKLPPGTYEERAGYVGYPPELIESQRRTWSAEQQALIADAGFMPSAATLFPNLSLVHNWPAVNEEGLIVPFISIRLWQPVGPGETEVYSWFAVDRSAPDWFKQASYKAYLMCFGSSGMFEQDDVENWTSITQMARGRLAQRLNLYNRMGIDREGKLLHDPVEGWPGPGRAFVGFGEYNQRELLNLWSRYLANGSAAPVAAR